VAGKEEKRQITAVVASSLAGDLLPLHSSSRGKTTTRSSKSPCPTSSNSCRGERLQCKELKFKTHPHAVLILDCWSVHTSKDFREWMKETHPHYHLVYVPAGCTGIAQPADVILQRPLKAGIVNAFSLWMATEIHLLLKNGAAPSELKMNTGMTTLEPLLVEWVWVSWRDQKDRTALIKRGWAKCGLGDVLLPTKQMEGLKFVADNMQRAEELAKEEARPAQSGRRRQRRGG
jgi:hypothetical protein